MYAKSYSLVELCELGGIMAMKHLVILGDRRLGVGGGWFVGELPRYSKYWPNIDFHVYIVSKWFSKLSWTFLNVQSIVMMLKVISLCRNYQQSINWGEASSDHLHRERRRIVLPTSEDSLPYFTNTKGSCNKHGSESVREKYVMVNTEVSPSTASCIKKMLGWVAGEKRIIILWLTDLVPIVEKLYLGPGFNFNLQCYREKCTTTFHCQ